MIRGFYLSWPERSNPLLLRFAACILLLAALPACSEPPYTNLDNAQLEILLQQNVPIYDIRRPDEWRQTGIVEGSKLLTYEETSGRVRADFLGRFAASAGKHKPVILICRSGVRSRTLARYLTEQMGYTQVFNVEDGIKRWIRDKRPVNKPVDVL